MGWWHWPVFSFSLDPTVEICPLPIRHRVLVLFKGIVNARLCWALHLKKLLLQLFGCQRLARRFNVLLHFELIWNFVSSASPDYRSFGAWLIRSVSCISELSVHLSLSLYLNVIQLAQTLSHCGFRWSVNSFKRLSGG